MPEQLIDRFGDHRLFLGTFFEGETVLVLVAFGVHCGELHPRRARPATSPSVPRALRRAPEFVNR